MNSPAALTFEPSQAVAAMVPAKQALGRLLAVRRRGIVLLTAAFAIAFNFFFSVGYGTETHPLAFFMLLEATMGALIVFATAAMVLKIQANTVTTADAVFYVTPFLFVGACALFAYLAFGQPFQYAFVEERRTFGFLYWFVFQAICDRYRLTFEDVLRALLWTAGLYLALGLLLQAVARPSLLARAIPDLDPRKLRIASPSVFFTICIVIGFARLIRGHRALSWSIVVVSLAGSVLIAQTRQHLLAAAIVALMTALTFRPLRTIQMLAAAAVGGSVVLLLVPDQMFDAVIGYVLPNIEEFSSENITSNTRTHTAGIAISSLIGNWFFGLGSLSLLWEGGLYRIYGKNVFINDIGLLGDFYRVGLLLPGFALAIGAMYVSLWRGTHPVHRPVMVGLAYFLIVQAPAGSFIPHMGNGHSLFALLMYASAAHWPLAERFTAYGQRRSTTARRSPTPASPRSALSD